MSKDILGSDSILWGFVYLGVAIACGFGVAMSDRFYPIFVLTVMAVIAFLSACIVFLRAWTKHHD